MNEETKINLGSAIRVATYILALVFGYVTISRDVDAHISAADARITALETTANNAKLAEIPATLMRIEGKVDRLDRDSRK